MLRLREWYGCLALMFLLLSARCCHATPSPPYPASSVWAATVRGNDDDGCRWWQRRIWGWTAMMTASTSDGVDDWDLRRLKITADMGGTVSNRSDRFNRQGISDSLGASSANRAAIRWRWWWYKGGRYRGSKGNRRGEASVCVVRV